MHRGKRIKISPECAAQMFSSLLANATATSIFDQLLMIDASPSLAYNTSKIEAVLAIALTEQMARINSLASIQMVGLDVNTAHLSMEMYRNRQRGFPGTTYLHSRSQSGDARKGPRTAGRLSVS